MRSPGPSQGSGQTCAPRSAASAAWRLDAASAAGLVSVQSCAFPPLLAPQEALPPPLGASDDGFGAYGGSPPASPAPAAAAATPAAAPLPPDLRPADVVRLAGLLKAAVAQPVENGPSTLRDDTVPSAPPGASCGSGRAYAPRSAA